MLNLKHLYYFHEFSQDLSTSKAAKRLGISAPALSNQLKQLEDFVGIPLTRRWGGKVTVTEQGEIMLHYTAQMFSAYDALKGKMAHATKKKATELKIGIGHNLGPSFSFDLLSLMEKASFADVKMVKITFDRTAELLEGLSHGKFDLVVDAFSAARREKVSCALPRLTFPIRVFASHDLFGEGAFAKRNSCSVTVAEIVRIANAKNIPMVLPERTSLLREETEHYLVKEKISPLRTIECNCCGGIVQLIERGQAYGLIPTPSMLDFKRAEALSMLGPKEGYWTHSISMLGAKGSIVLLQHPASRLTERFPGAEHFI